MYVCLRRGVWTLSFSAMPHCEPALASELNMGNMKGPEELRKHACRSSQYHGLYGQRMACSVEALAVRCVSLIEVDSLSTLICTQSNEYHLTGCRAMNTINPTGYRAMNTINPTGYSMEIIATIESSLTLQPCTKAASARMIKEHVHNGECNT